MKPDPNFRSSSAIFRSTKRTRKNVDWGRIPFPDILECLEAQTASHTVRADDPMPATGEVPKPLQSERFDSVDEGEAGPLGQGHGGVRARVAYAVGRSSTHSNGAALSTCPRSERPRLLFSRKSPKIRQSRDVNARLIHAFFCNSKVRCIYTRLTGRTCI